jgi:hypothetical protein
MKIHSKKIALVGQYTAVIAASMIADWFVQLSYYLYETSRNPHIFNGERTLMDYRTGFIGDLILLPIMNAVIFYVLLHSTQKLKRVHLLHVAFLGLAADILLHFFQGYLQLTNWSMPRPYQWDFVSYWHMVSFFFQISFVILFVYIAVRRLSASDRRVVMASYCVVAMMGLFVLLFLQDYVPLHTITTELAAWVHYLIG